MPYRVTCTVQGVNGVIAATRARIGISIFARSLVPEHLVELPPSAGLPPLGDIDLVLLTNARPAQPTGASPRGCHPRPAGHALKRYRPPGGSDVVLVHPSLPRAAPSLSWRLTAKFQQSPQPVAGPIDPSSSRFSSAIVRSRSSARRTIAAVVALSAVPFSASCNRTAKRTRGCMAGLHARTRVSHVRPVPRSTSTSSHLRSAGCLTGQKWGHGHRRPRAGQPQANGRVCARGVPGRKVRAEERLPGSSP